MPWSCNKKDNCKEMELVTQRFFLPLQISRIIKGIGGHKGEEVATLVEEEVMESWAEEMKMLEEKEDTNIQANNAHIAINLATQLTNATQSMVFLRVSNQEKTLPLTILWHPRENKVSLKLIILFKVHKVEPSPLRECSSNLINYSSCSL